MKGYRGFTSAWHALSASTAESAIEFKFSGVHHWTHGPQMMKYIETVLAQETTSAIAIDFLHYRYESGNDLFGLFSFGFDLVARRVRPICIVARGQTLTSLKTLLDDGNVGDAFDVSFVSTPAELTEWLHDKAGKTSA